MTTAVQPSELVFEFASNGMDEISQVNLTLQKPHFQLFLIQLCFAFMHKWACRLYFSKDLWTSV